MLSDWILYPPSRIAAGTPHSMTHPALHDSLCTPCLFPAHHLSAPHWSTGFYPMHFMSPLCTPCLFPHSMTHPTLHVSPRTPWLTLHSMSLPRTPSFRPALKYGVLSSALHASTLHSMSLPSTPSFRPALKYGVQNSILCVFAPHFMTHSAHHVSSPHWSAGFSSPTWGSLQAIRLECSRRVQVDFPELG